MGTAALSLDETGASGDETTDWEQNEYFDFF